MKIKNSKDGINLKLVFPVFFVLTLILSVIRFAQLLMFIDPITGFSGGGEVTFVVFYALIAVAALFFFAFAFLSKKGAYISVVYLENKAAAISTLFFGLGLVYDFFDSLINSVTSDGMVISGGTSSFSSLMVTGQLPYSLQSIFALISAVYIFSLSASLFKGNNKIRKHKLLALSPIAWAAFKIITRFIKQISYVKVSDLLLELLAYAFMILFFTAFSQVASGIYSKENRFKIVPYGLTAALIALSINIPRLIVTITGIAKLNADYGFNLADLLFGVFAFFICKAAVDKASVYSDRKGDR